MSAKKPWDENWTFESDLDKGGQGTTFVVVSKETGKQVVLKVLRNQKSTQARARMYQEVANLRVLHTNGAQVPSVYEANTDRYEESDAPLYFVMERINGHTLAKIIEERKEVPIEDAIKLVLDICETADIGIKNSVIHRDLKPENIVVRDLAKQDVVIVDYGLSFNNNHDGQLTQAGESLDNDFISLPERRIPGGDRGDPRSDITSICGLLYYCLTANKPVDLAGPDGHLPNRRPAVSVAKCLGDDAHAAVAGYRALLCGLR